METKGSDLGPSLHLTSEGKMIVDFPYAVPKSALAISLCKDYVTSHCRR